MDLLLDPAGEGVSIILDILTIEATCCCPLLRGEEGEVEDPAGRHEVPRPGPEAHVEALGGRHAGEVARGHDVLHQSEVGTVVT